MIILIVIIMAKIIVILPFRIIEFIIISGSSRSPVTLITNPAGVEFTRMHIVTVSGGGSRRRVLRRHSLPHRLIIYATLPADSTVKFTVGSWECPIVKSWTSNDFGGIQNYDSLSISNCQGAHPWGGGTDRRSSHSQGDCDDGCTVLTVRCLQITDTYRSTVSTSI